MKVSKILANHFKSILNIQGQCFIQFQLILLILLQLFLKAVEQVYEDFQMFIIHNAVIIQFTLNQIVISRSSLSIQ